MSRKKENLKKVERIKNLSEVFDSFDSKRSNIAFNFQFLTSGPDYGQSFSEWQRDQIILDLNEKLKIFSGKTKKDLITDKTLVIYDCFPANSRFKYPATLPRDSNKLSWARLRLTGRRRIVGFFSPGIERESDIFYVVFLDRDHDFYPVEMEHT